MRVAGLAIALPLVFGSIQPPSRAQTSGGSWVGTWSTALVDRPGGSAAAAADARCAGTASIHAQRVSGCAGGSHDHASCRGDVWTATFHALRESDATPDRSCQPWRIQSARRSQQFIWNGAHHDRRCPHCVTGQRCSHSTVNRPSADIQWPSNRDHSRQRDCLQ